jgi:nucleotide-binding universal stress UspA family protein
VAASSRSEDGASQRRIGYERIALCLSPSESPARAVAIAGALAAGRRPRLVAIATIEVALELPLEMPHAAANDRARDALEAVRELAGSHRLAVESVVLLARDAGEAIVAELVQQQAELVLIPERVKPRQDARRLSRITEYILHRAPCRVLLVAAGPVAATASAGHESGPCFRSSRPSDAWPTGEFIDRIDAREGGARRA